MVILSDGTVFPTHNPDQDYVEYKYNMKTKNYLVTNRKTGETHKSHEVVNFDGNFRYQLIDFEESRTDQAAAKEMTMLSLVKQIERGQLPRNIQTSLAFGEAPAVTSYAELFEKAEEARLLFSQLPAELKSRLHNDPKNMDAFLADKKNEEYLVKIGFLERPKSDPVLDTLKNIEKNLTPVKEPPKEPQK